MWVRPHAPSFPRAVFAALFFIGVLPSSPCLWGVSHEDNGLRSSSSSSSSYRSTDQDTMPRRRRRGCVASQGPPLSTAMRRRRSGAPLVTAQPHSRPPDSHVPCRDSRDVVAVFCRHFHVQCVCVCVCSIYFRYLLVTHPPVRSSRLQRQYLGRAGRSN